MSEEKPFHPVGTYKHHRTKFFYCAFCRITIDDPRILEERQGKIGRWHNVTRKHYLCSRCGGAVYPQAKGCASPEVEGTTRIGRGIGRAHHHERF